MGNSLCKEQSGSAADGGGSSNMFGCLQICPSRGTGKKQHNWNKHIYETRPPLPVRHQPPTDPSVAGVDEAGFKTITLTRPVEYRSNNTDLAPVPPPRKKRTSMLSLKNAGSVKNGFKEVFGSDSPRRYSVDSIHNSKRYKERGIDVSTPVRNSVSCHDVCDDSFADFSRDLSPKNDSLPRKVLPKVGNKKSDKILGENLSDLSEGQQLAAAAAAAKLAAERDPIDQFVEENVAEKQSVQKAAAHNSSSANKSNADESAVLKEKAALLMNILDRYSQEENYENRDPVVEEVIVPRKKKTGHICDDDEFHKHFHKHEKQENDKLREELKEEDLEAMIVVPKKPQRDLTIYRKSQENINVEEGEISATDAPPVAVAPIRRKKSLNRDDMPSPPPRPMKSGIVVTKSQENMLSMSPTKDLELEPPSLQLNLSSEKVKAKEAKETEEKKTTTPPPSPVVPSRNYHQKQVSISDSVTSIEPSSPGGDVRPPSRQSQKDSLSKRVLQFQMSQEYNMDISNDHNGGSDQFTPTSKLDPVTKKISVTSMASTSSAPNSPSVGTPPIEDPITVTNKLRMLNSQDSRSEKESLSASDTLSNEGSSDSQKTIVQCVVQKKIGDKKDVRELPAEETLFNQSSILLAEKNVENILSSDLNMQALSDVLNDMYDKTILEEFQNYLETEGTEVDEVKLPGDHSDGLMKDLKLRRAEKASRSTTPTPTSPVIDVVELPEPPSPTVRTKSEKSKKKKKKAKKQPAEEDQVSVESISDDGYSNLVKTASKEDVTNKTLLAVSTESRPRRESICDVDYWFNNHIDDAPSSLNVDHLKDVRMMRRGSDFGVGYDTGTTFPFGRSRHESESSDFFEVTRLTKSFDKGSNSSLNKGSNGSLNLGSNSELNKDHSSLLRFVVPSPTTSPLAGDVVTASTSAGSIKTMEEIKNVRNKQVIKQVTIPQIEIVVTDEPEERESEPKKE